MKIDTNLIDCVSKYSSRVTNEDYVPHGKKVVRFMRRNNGLDEFGKRWRQHFIHTMSPQFLPKLWSVDYNHHTYKVKPSKVMVC